MYYIEILDNELNSTTTYEVSHKSENDIVLGHINFIAKHNFNLISAEHTLPSMYWIPKLHKRPYKQRFIANSSVSSTTKLSKLLTLCLSVIKSNVIKLSEKIYANSGKNIFWSIKNTNDILLKLKNIDYQASYISCYDFSTLYTTLPHNLIKEKLSLLIKNTYKSIGCKYIACTDSTAFFTSDIDSKKSFWTCNELCEALLFLLDNIFVKFKNVIFRQIVGVPMGTNCAPLVADLFLFCYERDFMLGLDTAKQGHIINAFNYTSRYLDDICNLDNPFFEKYIPNIYPKELQLNKANNNNNRASFLDLE